MHRTRNAAYGQPYRGFESLPLRQNPSGFTMANDADAPSCFPLQHGRTAQFRLFLDSSDTFLIAASETDRPEPVGGLQEHADLLGGTPEDLRRRGGDGRAVVDRANNLAVGRP